ncbi:YqaE/Pmp3 family membrane protein [Pseudoflavitalea sp. G-6-1-2]|uniref:YqaE/Pmp3 family membrane protein n=1 Tax=Pseudoflavitalea sp. G-6-1-2 TaxID=2728841 RepID=UPI001F0F0044|nr:YqaE/Pmp3 family membrane protein [Pseudoflavitalea sp. G-6-1-2]
MKKLNTRLFAFLLLTLTISSPVLATVMVEPVPVSVPASKEPTPEEVKAALESFKALPRKERKERMRDAKKLMKEYRADKRAGKSTDETNQVLLAILAILLPPLAVYLKEGQINGKFWLSLVLTLLFWIPGVVYALLVVFDAI